MSHVLKGRCHCGALSVVVETPTDPVQLPLRACGCSFCRKHGVRSTSDPDGALTFAVGDRDELQRYRFATRTAETLICRTCGVYVGAVIEIDGALYGIANVNVLDDQAPFDRPAEAKSYEHQTAAERIARRRTMWMPAAVEGA